MSDKPASVREPRLLDRVRERIRVKHYSIRTETAYVDWIKRFILYHGKRHPSEMGAREVEAFLTHLAVERNVAASTQNQALAAILFLYREVLGVELDWLEGVTRAKKPQRMPTVLSPQEVEAVLAKMSGTPGLVARLLYGTGMRLMEALRLRVQDLDLRRRELVVRGGKGAKDRVTVLPTVLVAPLREHLDERRSIYDRDQTTGRASVWLPHALAEKYPNAPREWGWQYVFVASALSVDPAATLYAVIIWTDPRSRGAFARRLLRRRSSGRCRRMCCVTRSQRICLNRATTSAPCRNCSATRTSARQ